MLTYKRRDSLNPDGVESPARRNQGSRPSSVRRSRSWRSAPIRLAPFAVLALAAGCSRGVVAIDPTALGAGSPRPVLVASVRAPATGPAVYGSSRAPLSFARFLLSVPPERERGSVTWPGPVINPRTDFVTLTAARLRDGEAFAAAISRQLGDTGHYEAIVFVHGYNNTFAAKGNSPTTSRFPRCR